MDKSTFDNNFNSEIGKAFRSLNARVAEYYSENDEELFDTKVTPISNFITAFYWGDYTALQVFNTIVRILSNYDLICYNESTREYKTYMDKTIIVRLNKCKKIIYNYLNIF